MASATRENLRDLVRQLVTLAGECADVVSEPFASDHCLLERLAALELAALIAEDITPSAQADEAAHIEIRNLRRELGALGLRAAAARERGDVFHDHLMGVHEALAVTVESWAHLPAAVRDAITGSGEAQDELHRLGVLLDEARTEASRRGALVLHVIDALPCGALSMDDVPAAVAAYTAELREERQKALSRAAEAERRQLTAERLAAQFGSRLTPDQRADAHAAIAASEAGNG